MPDTLILPLDSPEATLAVAGGKGANLSRLIRGGFPAPGGFIVTTAAYDAFVAANGLRAWLLLTAGAAAADAPAALENASAAIRARFAAAVLPPGLAEVVRAAYLGLDATSVSVAVRSSATAEDLPGLSFAGQQDTFLNVVGEEALLYAVVNCWSSLWTGRAIGYRARNGISHADASLAVVVQAMVQSEVAGVLFTANPLTGRRKEAVVDAAFGLGEALVAGRVEPDHYVIAADDRIIGKRLGRKQPVAREDAAPATLAAGDAADRQALPDGAVIELARLGRRVEALFGTPQDIEWAWADGRLWLLQARPITSLYPLPDGEMAPSSPLVVWISFGAVQGMLDPFTPLGRDVMRSFIAGMAGLFGYRFSHESLPTLIEAGERLFINITGALRNGFGRRMARAVTGFVEPGIGQALTEIWDEPELAPTAARPRFAVLRRIVVAFLPVAVRFLATLLRPDARRRRIQRRIEALVTSIEARGRQAVTLAERLALLPELLEVLPVALLRGWLPTFAPAMAMLNALMHLAAELPDGRRSVLEITRGLPHNVTTEMDLALWATAQRIQAAPPAAARFATDDAAALAAAASRGALPPAAQAAIDAFLARYGRRGVGEIDLGRPRWRDDPTPVMEALQSYLGIRDSAQAPDVVFARSALAAEATIERLADALARSRGGWLRSRLARFAGRRVRALAGLRESLKFTIIRLLGVAREALLASSRELVADGLLAQADDVFFLRLAELHALAAGEQGRGEAHLSLQQLVAERRASYAAEKLRRQTPRILLSDGRAFYEGVHAAAGAGENVIAGSPVSPGMVEGLVRVVLDPHAAGLRPGEILVCPGTDPAWTPLFLAAGGLVMEVGGLMTHGSVVAREYGIPAVVGVTRATQRLQTGQRVRVDGSAGRIEILEPLVTPLSDS
jgi:pyruvate,water dikinase